MHGRRTAGTAEHRDHRRRRTEPQGDPDHRGHRLDRRWLQSASALRSVTGQRRRQRAGVAQFLPASPGPGHPDRIALGDGSRAAGFGHGYRQSPIHRHLPDPAGGGVDRQRPHRGRRLLVPVAPDGLAARGRRSGRLQPHHRGPFGRRRQDRGSNVLPALPGLARVVQQLVAGAHRQGCSGRFPGRPGAGGAGDGRTIQG